MDLQPDELRNMDSMSIVDLLVSQSHPGEGVGVGCPSDSLINRGPELEILSEIVQ